MKKLTAYLRYFFYKIANRGSKKSVVLLHIGRTGSTVLGSLLNQHTSVEWGKEVFHNYDNKYAKSNRFKGVKDAPLFILKSLIAFSKAKVYGYEIKCMPEQDLSIEGLQYSIPELLTELELVGTQKFIALLRKNALRRAISERKGQLAGKWHAKNADKEVAKQKVYLNIAQPNPYLKYTLLEYLKYQLELNELIATEVEKKNGLILTYEDDIFSNPNIAYEKTLSYLELKKEQVEVKLRKTNDLPLSELLENFGEVSELLKETEFSWMLHG